MDCRSYARISFTLRRGPHPASPCRERVRHRWESANRPRTWGAQNGAGCPLSEVVAGLFLPETVFPPPIVLLPYRMQIPTFRSKPWMSRMTPIRLRQRSSTSRVPVKQATASRVWGSAFCERRSTTAHRRGLRLGMACTVLRGRIFCLQVL